jgi:hypothetical protein
MILNPDLEASNIAMRVARAMNERFEQLSAHAQGNRIVFELPEGSCFVATVEYAPDEEGQHP